MAAAIPATNKWLLTKQASVALSGPRDDSYGESGGAGEREADAGRRTVRLLEGRAGAEMRPEGRAGRRRTPPPHPRGAFRRA